MVYIELTTNSF